MYVCMSECLRVCLDVWMSVCMSACLNVCMCVWMSVCMSGCLNVCMYVWMSECVYVCPDVCMSACMNVWMTVVLVVWRYKSMLQFCDDYCWAINDWLTCTFKMKARETHGRWHIRSTVYGNYNVPRFNSEFGRRAFSFAAPGDWNVSQDK